MQGEVRGHGLLKPKWCVRQQARGGVGGWAVREHCWDFGTGLGSAFLGMLVKPAGGIRPRERSEVDTPDRVRALSFQHPHWQGVTFHPIQTKLHSAGAQDITWPYFPRYHLVLPTKILPSPTCAQVSN